MYTSFQSPFRRGNGCYYVTYVRCIIADFTFSPLFVGAMVATMWYFMNCLIPKTFSPLFIGAMVAT